MPHNGEGMAGVVPWRGQEHVAACSYFSGLGAENCMEVEAVYHLQALPTGAESWTPDSDILYKSSRFSLLEDIFPLLKILD